MKKRKSKRKAREWTVVLLPPIRNGYMPQLLVFSTRQVAIDCGHEPHEIIKVREVLR